MTPGTGGAVAKRRQEIMRGRLIRSYAPRRCAPSRRCRARPSPATGLRQGFLLGELVRPQPPARDRDGWPAMRTSKEPHRGTSSCRMMRTRSVIFPEILLEVSFPSAISRITWPVLRGDLQFSFSDLVAQLVQFAILIDQIGGFLALRCKFVLPDSFQRFVGIVKVFQRYNCN